MDPVLASNEVRHVYASGADGNRIHGLDFGGDGPTLICLHGVTGNAWNWHTVAQGLLGCRRVLALDFRGYGESQWSPEHRYTTADHVADLALAVESLSAGEPVDLAGSSWGALVALQYAADHPDAVGRLAVIDVEPSFEQGETELFGRPEHHDDHADVRAALERAYPNARAETVELMAATCFAPAPRGRLVPKHDPFFFERWPFRSDDHWSRLGELAMPVLFVHAADSFVRSEVMAEMDRLTADSRLANVDVSTHVIPVDNPAGLLDVLVPFLTEPD